MAAHLAIDERQIAPSRRRASQDVEQAALAALSRHMHFRGRVDRFAVVVYDEVLVVRGVVPSFYLKQLVQTVLKEVVGPRRVCNEVDVVNPQGLSSVGDAMQRRDAPHDPPCSGRVYAACC